MYVPILVQQKCMSTYLHVTLWIIYEPVIELQNKEDYPFHRSYSTSIWKYNAFNEFVFSEILIKRILKCNISFCKWGSYHAYMNSSYTNISTTIMIQFQNIQNIYMVEAYRDLKCPTYPAYQSVIFWW